MLYRDEIALILQDLGLPADHPVGRYFKDKPYLKKTRTKTTVGLHSGVAHTTGRVLMATQRSPREVLETTAHELRHEWQTFTGVLTVGSYERGKKKAKTTVGWKWTGTVYAPEKNYSFSHDYWTRPHEVDARGYAADVMERLFKDWNGPEGPRTLKLAVAALFVELV